MAYNFYFRWGITEAGGAMDSSFDAMKFVGLMFVASIWGILFASIASIFIPEDYLRYNEAMLLIWGLARMLHKQNDLKRLA